MTQPPPTTPLKTEPSQPGTHQHRHRRVHYHRHHHRHLTKQRPLGADSLETLALLATQVMAREPLVITRKGQNTNATTNINTPTMTITTPNAPGDEYPIQSEKKRFAPEERDKGLQLRPVKRVELATIDAEDHTASQGQSSKRESALKPLPNGRGSMDGPSKKPAHPSYVQGANNQTTKSGISSTKDLVGRSSSKHRRP